MSNEKEKKCKNCLLFNKKNLECKVATLIDGKEYHLPVEPEDNCHFLELGISVEQVRWWEENNSVKMEYPINFFGTPDKDDDGV